MSDDDTRTDITDTELTDMYDEMLDDVHNSVTVAGIEFQASRVLETQDPIAYRCGLNDYYDSISDEYYCEDME